MCLYAHAAEKYIAQKQALLSRCHHWLTRQPGLQLINPLQQLCLVILCYFIDSSSYGKYR